jgi:divalent metal cation (Fe/Co/Zn/Cd) transporter
VVFGEDIAALLGLVFALFAIVATFLTGNPLWDAVGTITIGVLLLVIAVFVAIEVKDLLIGQSVDPETLTQMHEYLDSRPEIREVFSLLTMQFGPDAMVAIKARMVPTGSERDLIVTINTVERDFRSRFPITSWLFFEPDVED